MARNSGGEHGAGRCGMVRRVGSAREAVGRYRRADQGQGKPPVYGVADGLDEQESPRRYRPSLRKQRLCEGGQHRNHGRAMEDRPEKRSRIRAQRPFAAGPFRRHRDLERLTVWSVQSVKSVVFYCSPCALSLPSRVYYKNHFKERDKQWVFTDFTDF